MPSADFLGTAEPAFDNQFMVYFTALPTLTPFYVNSINLPTMTWGDVKSSYFITDRKFATGATVADVKMDVKDFVEVNTAAAVWAWFLSVGNPTAGTLNAPSAYKSSGMIILTDGRGNPLNTWTLTGAWPKVVTFGSLKQATGGAGAIIEVSIDLAVDRVDLA